MAKIKIIKEIKLGAFDKATIIVESETSTDATTTVNTISKELKETAK